MIRFLSMMACLALTSGPLQASMHLLLEDTLDDPVVVTRSTTNPAVVASARQWDAIRQRLLRLKEPDFESMFGKPVALPQAETAIPVSQPRALTFSGIRHLDPELNKDHRSVYSVGPHGYTEVWYSIDGETPANLVFRLPIGGTFRTLTEQNLAHRLEWEAGRRELIDKWLLRRWREVYEFEVDAARLTELHAGDHSPDIKTKLSAWIASGRRLNPSVA